MEKIEILGYRINLIRKNIKHSYLRIDLAKGEINLTSPLNLSRRELENIIIDKEDWIKEGLKRAEDTIVIEEVKAEEGEIVYLFSKAYRLSYNYIDSFPESVELKADRIYLNIKKSRSQEKKQELLREFYRGELIKKAGPYSRKWEEILGLSPREYRTKEMKTRWGTCNVNRKRVWLNLDLARLDEKFLEYIILHELIHFFEGGHGRRFKELMSRYMEDWEEKRRELNRYIVK